LAYNSNHIEGNRLTDEQTRYIYETSTISTLPGETASVNDITETVNHFRCFDFMLSTADNALSEGLRKR
jgi:Fic family protein